MTANEALVVLTLLIPVHSRVISRQENNATCQPLQRFLVASNGRSDT
jgi:hypothetical protein